MPAEPASSSLEKPAEETGPVGQDDDGYEPSIADPNVVPGDPKEIPELLWVDGPVEVGDVVMKDGEKVVEDSEDDDDEELDVPHNLPTHFPKSKSCEICKRARMTSRYHR